MDGEPESSHFGPPATRDFRFSDGNSDSGMNYWGCPFDHKTSSVEVLVSPLPITKISFKDRAHIEPSL